MPSSFSIQSKRLGEPNRENSIAIFHWESRTESRELHHHLPSPNRGPNLPPARSAPTHFWDRSTSLLPLTVFHTRQSVIGGLVIVIMLPLVSLTTQSASYVFTHFEISESTGITSSVYAVILSVLVSQLEHMRLEDYIEVQLLLLLEWQLKVQFFLEFIPKPKNHFRMQVQGTNSLVGKCDKYSSPLDCAVKTIKNEGLKGIFCGDTATLLKESVGNVIFFSTYEYTRYYMYMQVSSTSSVYSHLPNILIDAGIGATTGGLGGVAYWSVVLPFDVAKTVIQTAPDSTSSRNPFRILSSIYRMKGIKGCYTGIGPTLARAFPANAAALLHGSSLPNF